MRDRPERFVILPFSIGCVSHSSISVANEKNEAIRRSIVSQRVGDKAKNQSGLSWGFQRVMKGLKGLSQMFVYREDEEEDREMVIGFPTDVKHVGHIGWDGSNNLSTTKGWNHIPSLSLTQFEVAMSKQAHHLS